MSGKACSHVLDAGLSEDRPALLIALVLATYANDRGEGVRPSVATVARQTGYSPAQARRIIHRLVELGVLQLVEEAHRYRAREYRFAWHSEHCRLFGGRSCGGVIQGSRPDASPQDQGSHSYARQGSHPDERQGSRPDASRSSHRSSHDPPKQGLHPDESPECQHPPERIAVGARWETHDVCTVCKTEIPKVADLSEIDLSAIVRPGEARGAA